MLGLWRVLEFSKNEYSIDFGDDRKACITEETFK